MNNIRNLLSKELSIIDDNIRSLSINRNIDEKLQQFLNASDKRIRSEILLLYLKSAIEKDLPNEIYTILTAGEIIHNASLLHDDFIDNSEKRRGLSAFWKEFSPQISILCGDYLLSVATDYLLTLNNSKILQTFLNATKCMSNAEINQFFLRGNIPTEKEYLEICQDKTASLFEAMFESCAIICNIDKEKAKTFAREFGIVFQIKNDLEPNSALNDKANQLYTAKDILGIEKTKILTHNYLVDLKSIINSFYNNKYKKLIEELLGSYEL